MAKQKKLLVKIRPGSFVFAELFFSRLADFAKGSQELVLRTGF